MKCRLYIAIWIVALFSVICFYAPDGTALLGDRDIVPAHSAMSRILSYTFRPIHVAIETAPFAGLVSREVRHNVFSIVNAGED